MGLQLLFIISLLLIGIALGCPVMAAIGCTAVISMMTFMGENFFGKFASIAYEQGISPNQLIAPLFILMAEFLARGGIAEDLFTVLNMVTKRIKGGLALATTLACTVFAALCGSSPATAAAVGRIATSAMTKRRYRKDFAIGTVAGGGTLGIMIPPSITLVSFGILTETSIAKLLIAGLIPGLMLSLLMIISIVIRVRLNPALIGELKPDVLESGAYDANAYAVDLKTAVDDSEMLSSDDARVKRIVIQIIPAFVLIILVLGSMYRGIATPTESAGIGAIGAFILVAVQKRLDKNMFAESLKATARTSAMMIFLVISGFCLSFVLAYLRIPSSLTKIIISAGLNKYMVLILLYILWFILGCLMDPGSMIILTIPFLFSTMIDLGFDPIWLGIVSTLCVEIGMITPPVGLNLFVLRSSTNVEMIHIIKGSFPYVLVLIVGLIILTVFPQIALFLPNNM
ncbi:MAG: TRAP transporter large permease [Peptococcaceae bacterium]|jgi:tripartite ATP-independent transporter DctM subunit|nr:TRAP transporter large permease [Peptococcaceae bacterium]